ncbi:MAG: radical SAM family heme chaperone HemW [Lachnospiraceae bacterium]|nr:radical SAM family heme chaperone HemW [Lachnospiraceae bacterium]
MEEKRISIYIHIPFCVRKCRYCDFPSFTDSGNIDSYFNALRAEIRAERETAGRITDTIYIGGGTPSLVPPFYIKEVMEEIGKKYIIGPETEISMEMNPGTVERNALKTYREAGINRLSMGCQSFNDESLKCLGRIHSAEDAERTYDELRKAGFENINIDLISDIPGEKAEDMERSLKKAAELSPEHISVYSLIIEPGTEFYKLREKGGLKDLPDEDEQEKTDKLIRQILRENNYMRYEISNYAKPGHECKHNMRYWTRGEYRGFGLSAASLIGNRRFTNIREMVYINNPGGILSEDRILSREEEMQEFLFLGLRMTAGISAADFSERFRKDIDEVFGKQLKKQIKCGFLEFDGDRYRYNTKGLDISNILMSEFL